MINKKKHMQGFVEKDKSGLIIDYDEIQEIIDNDDLKTEVIVKNGGDQIKAIVECEDDVGYIIIEETGEEEYTNRGTIHYSKTGAHLVPTARRR